MRMIRTLVSSSGARFVVVGLFLCTSSGAALFSGGVPNEVQMPGTQPLEVTPVHSDNCVTCHGSYDSAVEPGHNWKGSMMAHAGRDPVFWAGMAVAESSYPGAGDMCLRCHAQIGWMGGRSVPTDGSAMARSTEDADGVSCKLCHTLTDPDQSEHLGVQNAPFIANDGGMPVEGHYGSGQYVLWGDAENLGPYDGVTSPHGTMQSSFHRSSELCGTCHDVSNPLTGDLAPNNGAQIPLAPGTFSGTVGTALETKAAFNNPPYRYGIIERTFSEHVASGFPGLRVSDYATLPAELQDGAIERSYLAAQAAGLGGDYADGTTRYFTCQTCHMRPVVGKGAVQAFAPVRTDLPLHDLTGGNYWAPDAITYLEAQGRLRLGNGLSASDLVALSDGKARAVENLELSASLDVQGDVLRVVNLTGHKLITGYHEGRRMWLNVKWYDIDGVELREDGEYGTITADVGGVPTAVDTILDLSDPYLRLYGADYGITQEWADKLVTLGTSGSLPLGYDRETGAVTQTLGALAAQAPGTSTKTFHFVLNDIVLSDTRIPPYGFDYDEAQTRNALPVPAPQYGNPGPGGTYDYFDEVLLSPPVGAAYATIDLLFQPTSWEYIQFLDLANDGSSAFLATVGADLLEAWLATGMAEPVVMASTTWEDPDVLYTGFCSGDGSGTACPCGNTGDTDNGCDNSFATGGAHVEATGIPFFHDVTLHGTGLPSAAAVVALRGTLQANGGLGTVFGDGLLCVGGTIRRIEAGIASAGQIALDMPHGAGPGTFHYQLWYRNQAASFCTSDRFNTSNAVTVVYP